MKLETEPGGEDHAEPRDLGDSDIDEDDAAPQYFPSQRHMGRQYQKARDECGARMVMSNPLSCIVRSWSEPRLYHHLHVPASLIV
uniref:Uncharacterized protein n=1 Tax=Candidatus Kentrum sp. FW TaxID=2126338 RepID=A0A450U427_9GAMM|nr:MAG: hypothetical protein BECKFW1821C_GA0114237_11605 [Candidatus Kentron sp. FW]